MSNMELNDNGSFLDFAGIDVFPSLFLHSWVKTSNNNLGLAGIYPQLRIDGGDWFPLDEDLDSHLTLQTPNPIWSTIFKKGINVGQDGQNIEYRFRHAVPHTNYFQLDWDDLLFSYDSNSLAGITRRVELSLDGLMMDECYKKHWTGGSLATEGAGIASISDRPSYRWYHSTAPILQNSIFSPATVTVNATAIVARGIRISFDNGGHTPGVLPLVFKDADGNIVSDLQGEAIIGEDGELDDCVITNDGGGVRTGMISAQIQGAGFFHYLAYSGGRIISTIVNGNPIASLVPSSSPNISFVFIRSEYKKDLPGQGSENVAPYSIVFRPIINGYDSSNSQNYIWNGIVPFNYDPGLVLTWPISSIYSLGDTTNTQETESDSTTTTTIKLRWLSYPVIQI